MAIAFGVLVQQFRVECHGGTRHDWIEAVLLVSVPARDDTPAAIALFEEIVGAAPAGDVAQHALDHAALRDLDLGARDGAIAGDVDRRAAEHVVDARAALIALLADGDEFLECALEPGRPPPPT